MAILSLLLASKTTTISAASAVGSLIGIGVGKGRAVGTPMPKSILEAKHIEVDTTGILFGVRKKWSIFLSV